MPYLSSISSEAVALAYPLPVAVSAVRDLKEEPDWASKPSIKWNFTKFVIDRQGNVVARFEPTAYMENVEDCIVSLLEKVEYFHNIFRRCFSTTFAIQAQSLAVIHLEPKQRFFHLLTTGVLRISIHRIYYKHPLM